MNYSEIIGILKEFNLLVNYENINLYVEYLSCDSRDIRKNTMFFCKGFEFKESYLDDAIYKGISCYVSEIDYKKDVVCILVSDIKKSMSIIAKYFYPDNLTLLGVTGTKGKTTTCRYINNIINEMEGKKTGFITTINLYTGKREEVSHNTTPEGIDLHRYLNEMSDENLKYATLEVSSQAYKMSRIYGMHFKVGCFLNIGLDHLSPHEHSSFEDYLECKVNFLRMCDNVVLCKHTDYYDDIVKELGDKKIITYGLTSDCDYYIKDIVKENGIQYFNVFHDGKEESYSITMPGSFNILNAVCSVIVGKLCGASYSNIKKALFETKVEGRTEIYQGICPIIIDYAHNKISVETLMTNLINDYPGYNLKLIFGCPGKKAFNRRKDIATLADKYASYIYLTEEDSQGCDITEICNDIAKYIKSKPYEIIPDRKKCIEYAISKSKPDDLIAIIGKGDETYQLRDDYVYYESDISVVKNYLGLYVN